MECERCKKENQQVKAGKTKAVSQRYKCKHCGKVYTPKQKGRRYDKEIKETGNKIVYGRKQWKNSREDIRNRKKYVAILDKEI